MTSDTILFFASSCTEKTLENVTMDVNPFFDIVIFYYKKLENNSLKQKNFGGIINKSITYQTEGKGQILLKIDEFLTENNLYKKYKYIGIFDDDLVCSFSGLNEILSIARKYKLDSFQPSLTKDSFFSHEFTLKKEDSLLHYVKWVEIMPPFYDTNLFRLSASFLRKAYLLGVWIVMFSLLFRE